MVADINQSNFNKGAKLAPYFLNGSHPNSIGPFIYLRLKAGRLVFSSCEVHLRDERARKNAEMPAFNSNNGAP